MAANDFPQPVKRLGIIAGHVSACLDLGSTFAPVATSATGEVALIVGGGPGVSASCVRLFAAAGLRVAVAARDPRKPAMRELSEKHGASCYACDASSPEDVERLFSAVEKDFGAVPRLVVHNVDGRVGNNNEGSAGNVFRRKITEVEPELVKAVLLNSTFSAFLVGQQASRRMLETQHEDGHLGTIIFTNASAAYKGFPLSGAFAAACHGKSGLAQSMARELFPKGIHIAHVPVDGAVGWRQPDGSRQHWAAGAAENDNMIDPDRVADLYMQIHQQHPSTWSFETVVRPWKERF